MCLFAGAKSADSPAAVVAQTKTAVTMLPASQHVKEVYTSDNGIFRSVEQIELKSVHFSEICIQYH